jgi:hypothetical protein
MPDDAGAGRERSWQIMLRIVPGIAFSVSQSVEHPLRRLPPDLFVRSQIPHRVSFLFEFEQDFGDGSNALEGCRTFALLARDIYPEFQLFGHPQFHFFQPVRMSYCASN